MVLYIWYEMLWKKAILVSYIYLEKNKKPAMFIYH